MTSVEEKIEKEENNSSTIIKDDQKNDETNEKEKNLLSDKNVKRTKGPFEVKHRAKLCLYIFFTISAWLLTCACITFIIVYINKYGLLTNFM